MVIRQDTILIVKNMSFYIFILLELIKLKGAQKMANIGALVDFFVFKLKLECSALVKKAKWILIFFILNNFHNLQFFLKKRGAGESAIAP